jgi:hypothetical protein
MVMTQMVENFNGTLTKMTKDHAKEQVLVLAVLNTQVLLAQWSMSRAHTCNIKVVALAAK